MFSTPEIALYDVLRLVAGAASLIVIFLTPFALYRPIPWHQRLRQAGAAIVGSAVIGAYLLTLGTVPTPPWRVFVVTIGMVAFAAGTVAQVGQYHREDRERLFPRRHGR